MPDGCSYAYYAFDDANASDVRHIGNTRQKNDLAAATLNYKLNNLVVFYGRAVVLPHPGGRRSHWGPAFPNLSRLPVPTVAGHPHRNWSNFHFLRYATLFSGAYNSPPLGSKGASHG